MTKTATEYSSAANSCSPQQSQIEDLALCSPKAPAPASWRAASFDLFDKLAARHEGLMGDDSFKLALEGLVKNDSSILQGRVPGGPS